MPRKQRFKPSRKPKPTNEEVGKTTIDQQTHGIPGDRGGGSREREEVHPKDVEVDVEERDQMNGAAVVRPT